MANITFTIPDVKLQRVIDALKNLHPIPTDQDGNPLFTDNQWAKEALRRWIIEQVQRWENHEAIKRAVVAKDDTIVN